MEGSKAPVVEGVKAVVGGVGRLVAEGEGGGRVVALVKEKRDRQFRFSSVVHGGRDVTEDVDEGGFVLGGDVDDLVVEVKGV